MTIDPWDLALASIAAHPNDDLEQKGAVQRFHRQRFQQALGEDAGDDDIMIGDDASTTLFWSDLLAKALRAGGDVAQTQIDKRAAAKGGGKATTKKDDETTSKPSKPEKQAIAPPSSRPFYERHPWVTVGLAVGGAGILGLAVAGLVGRRRK